MCGGCHGENGVPQEKTTPVIWGQHLGYLYLQLRDYKRGDRKDDQMTPVIDLLEREDLMPLAEYFSKKKWPSLGQPPAPADVAARAQRANGSVGCTGCHQASYLGEGTQPRLAGQWKEYLLQSTLDFRTRKRGNNPGMSDLMRATAEDDLKLRSRSTWPGYDAERADFTVSNRDFRFPVGPASDLRTPCAIVSPPVSRE